MSKTHRRSKQKKPPLGFDKNQWKRLNDTKIYDRVEWGKDDIAQDVGVIPSLEWRNINWKLVQKRVFKLQKLIFRASSVGEFSKMRKYQKLLTKSYYARLLAVRRVTQDNQGKKTAGVDGIKNLKPKQRFNLVKMLRETPKKPKPTRRVWIPKPGLDEKRPLGIPTIYDRALQCLHKEALEPEWEARFEPNSYGFRPGRTPQDAIEAIYSAIRLKPKYVLDADIAKCFDRINHKVLLDKVGLYPGRKLIKRWLKAGLYDEEQHQETEEGTPQGGVISPLLANIAFHGMEESLKEYAVNLEIRVETYSLLKGKYTRKLDKKHRQNSIKLIRYADDFVILHENLEVLLGAKAVIEKWLQPIGLELKPEKTRIAHTLWHHDNESPGFDFLGFNVRQYVNGTERGYKTLIKPSHKAVSTHYVQIKDVFDNQKTTPLKALISQLNPMISGWCNYHKNNVAKETFSKLDYQMWQRAWRWSKRRHPRKSRTWVKDKYFAPHGTRNWELHDGDIQLLKHADTAIERHVKVKGGKSPFDGDTVYWAARMGKHPEIPARKAKLLKKQKGRCAICGLPFGDEDLVEIDHIKPKSQGGKDRFDNYQAIHRHCHDTKTALEAVGRKSDTPEEPCAVKVASTVLKTNRGG